MAKNKIKCMWCLKETKTKSSAYCSRACSADYRTAMVFPLDYPDTVRLEYSEKEQRAWIRGKGWHLTPEEFLSFFGGRCHYCGDAIGDRVCVDRIDSSASYEVGNIVRCCGPCNMMKHVLSHDDFVRRCMKVTAIHGFPCSSGSDGSFVPGMLSRLSGY